MLRAGADHGHRQQGDIVVLGLRECRPYRAGFAVWGGVSAAERTNIAPKRRCRTPNSRPKRCTQGCRP